MIKIISENATAPLPSFVSVGYCSCPTDLLCWEQHSLFTKQAHSHWGHLQYWPVALFSVSCHQL